MSYELFIGLRYLKAKRKQTFVSLITLISIAGVMVGVTALIVVIAVMNGFKEGLSLTGNSSLAQESETVSALKIVLMGNTLKTLNPLPAMGCL